MIILIIVFESMLLVEHDNEAGPGWTPFNENKYYIMICLAFYMFEGIGSVLPVMEASDAKDNFNTLLVSALATLCTIHIIFSEFSYYVYGNDLNEPIIIMKLPPNNGVVVVAKIIFCVNILVSYPLVIYVTNNVIESILFSKMDHSELRKWLKNLSRTIIVFLSTFIGFTFYYSLHKILGFTAVVLGAWVVLITPSAIHNKLIAKNNMEKCFNWIIIVYAILAGVIFGSIIIYTWNDE
jgi:hypothetical protein